LADRLSCWNGLTDYEGQIVSLNHRPAGAAIRERVRKLLTTGAVAADLGCGPGFFLDALAGASALYAVDWSAAMLDRARERAPAGTAFLEHDLRDLALPQPADLAICLNALMPESHGDVISILNAIVRNMAPCGTLILVAPSLESQLYTINMRHYAETAAGREDESIEYVMDSFMNWFNNPLGYVRSKNDQVTKFWLRAEMEALLITDIGLAIEERFKAPVFWRDFQDEADWQAKYEPPWMWGWVVRKPA
tara:strand:- start:3284 stop:4033 length:750 start_codon:yes stop_codon:yes gene_type:complete